MMMRRWAVRMLQAAIRRASAEKQEWGRAMLREMDYVKGDWAAFWWAIGSMRSMLRPFDGPIRTAHDVPPGIRALRKATQSRTLAGYVVCVMAIAGFVWYLFLFRTPLQQAGCWLTIAAGVFMMYQLYVGRAAAPPVEAASPAAADFYRAELMRQRDFHRGTQFLARFVVLIPGYVLFCTASALASPKDANVFVSAMILFFVFLLLAIPANLRVARKYQRRIDELNALGGLSG